MTDDLAIPQVPEAAPDDPEDVSWALSTAEAMWARGDHSEGIKWVRRAAEAASEAENDTRALELAKAAADLASLIARMSKAAFGDEGGAPGPPPVPMSRPRSAPPGAQLRSASSSPPSIPASPASVTKVVATPNRSAPIPLPSKASQPPPMPAKSAPRAAARPQPTPTAQAELITRTKSAPVAAKSPISNRPPDSARKGRRKSRDELEGAARMAGVLDTPPLPAASSGFLPTGTTETAQASDRPRRLEAEATVVAHVKDIVDGRASSRASSRPSTRAKAASGSTDEWDASPTQNLTGDDLIDAVPEAVAGSFAGAFPNAFPERATRAGAAPGEMGPGRASVKASPAASSTPRSVRPPPATKHDPAIVTSQAVRVVVWRDGAGVHVAPAGTVVSAITVDAVLVALEEGADLTAWLSQRG